MTAVPVKEDVMAAPVLVALSDLLTTIEYKKQAAAKTAMSAESARDDTSHPTGDADDQTQKNTTGSRAAEHTKDVKNVPGASVDATPPQNPDQDQVQNSQGTTQSSTGKDPATEDAYKGTKKDPGTSHPATTEDGEKYGAAMLQKFASMDFLQLHAHAEKLANDITSSLAASGSSLLNTPPSAPAAGSSPASGASPSTSKGAAASTPAEAAPASQEAKQAAAIAGYTAAAAANPSFEDLVKQGAMAIIQDAEHCADLVAHYLRLTKRAGDDEESSDKPKEKSSGGGAPPAEPPADAGGAPPMDPAAMGGGGGEEEILNELISAALEAGISPEELLAMIQGAGGGGDPMAGGGAPPMDPAMMGGGDPMAAMGGGAPPADPAMMGKAAAAAQRAQLAVLFKSAADHRKSGKFVYRAPKTAEEAAIRQQTQKYLREIAKR
jgi:hypothetical protein